MKIAASILFDSAYVESALITAHELSSRSAVFDVLHLVFVHRGTPDDDAVRDLLGGFVATRTGPMKVNAIEIKNTLPQFDSFHFNNSIIYKALVPAILPGSPFIFNLDAGTLLGADFDAYLQEVIATLCKPDANWVLAANNGSPAESLSPAQLTRPHHSRYPSGAVLLFNTRQYLASGWSARYLGLYERMGPELRYAEQELMCFVAEEHELVDLPRKGQLRVAFLGDKVLGRMAEPLAPSAADDCVYFKFAGSFKPWKYWVLDPDKAIYLRRREQLEQHFPLSGHPVVEAQRTSCLRSEWEGGFLKLYERYLSTGVAA